MSSETLQVPSQAPPKKSTQWTNRLASLADEEKAEANPTTPTELSDTMASYGVEVPLRLEGPYFTPADPAAYKTVICLVAGTGLSGAIAIAAAFHAQKANKPRSDTKAAALIGHEASATAAESSRRWNRCIVIWVVREKDYVDMPFFKGKLMCTSTYSLCSPLKRGRVPGGERRRNFY